MTTFDVHMDKALREVRRDRDTLHAALRESLAALETGAAATPDASVAFMATVPAEVGATVRGLRAQLAAAERERDEARRERDEAQADFLACAEAIGVVHEADGHATKPGPVEAVVAHICAAVRAERELDEARAALLAPLRYESNGEAGDGQHVCEGCGEEREEPHTWRACAERLFGLMVDGIDAQIEHARRVQAEIERDEARVRESAAVNVVNTIGHLVCAPTYEPGTERWEAAVDIENSVRSLLDAQDERNQALHRAECAEAERDEARAARAKAEADAAALRATLTDFAERECHYGDDCPPRGTRHGQCDGCRAREALRATSPAPEPVAAAERAVVEAAIRWRNPGARANWDRIVISAHRDLEHAVDALAAARKDGAT